MRGEEETLRPDHEPSGRFRNLKPRLLRHNRSGATGQDQEEQETEQGQDDRSHGDSPTLH